ncbi:MAG TPA: hypothetical protein VN804_03800, partial [Solirubrobacteraceae bacterium]|nr:hypothetical protein [Solirubrobacteraceae bacterium]
MSIVIRATHAPVRRTPPPISSRPRRLLALAIVLVALSLAVCSASANGAAAASASKVSTTRLSELLRKFERKPAQAPAAGASTSAQPNANTTTFVPAGGATASPTTAAPATAPAATPTTVTSAPAVSTPATAPTTSPGATSATAPAATAAQAPAGSSKASTGDRPLSTGAIVIAALAALLILACLGWALARRRAFEPRWLLSLRHATAEAGFRASATWSEFLDWVRLGH